MLPGITVKSVSARAARVPPGLALPAIIIDSAKGQLDTFTLITTLHDFRRLYGEREDFRDSRYYDAVSTLLSVCRGVYVCRVQKQLTAASAAFSVNANEDPLGGGSSGTEDAWRTADLGVDLVVDVGSFDGTHLQSFSSASETSLAVHLHPTSRFAQTGIDIVAVRITHTVPFPIGITLSDGSTTYTVPGYDSGMEIKTTANGLSSSSLQSIQSTLLGDFPYSITSIEFKIKGEDLEDVGA